MHFTCLTRTRGCVPNTSMSSNSSPEESPAVTSSIIAVKSWEAMSNQTVATPRWTPNVATPRWTPNVATPRWTPNVATPRWTPNVATPRWTPNVATPHWTPNVGAYRQSRGSFSSGSWYGSEPHVVRQM